MCVVSACRSWNPIFTWLPSLHPSLTSPLPKTPCQHRLPRSALQATDQPPAQPAQLATPPAPAGPRRLAGERLGAVAVHGALLCGRGRAGGEVGEVGERRRQHGDRAQRLGRGLAGLAPRGVNLLAQVCGHGVCGRHGGGCVCVCCVGCVCVRQRELGKLLRGCRGRRGRWRVSGDGVSWSVGRAWCVFDQRMRARGTSSLKDG